MDEDIFRLDVAMDDVVVVGVCQPGENLPHDRDGVGMARDFFSINGRRLVPGTYSIVR